MASIETLIEQVRAILIQTEDTKPRNEIYNQFINECKANNLTEDDFYKKVLKTAHKSIDWNFIEEQKQQKERERIAKEEKEKAIELELEELKKNIKHAPKFIDRLIKTAFDDNVVERGELISIFDKAERLSQDTYELAERISALFEEKNFKAYPKANYDLPSLRQTLCSTDWHSSDRYLKLTTPPPEPFPWKMVATGAILFLFVATSLTYIFYLKPKWRDDASPRYYTIANDATLRSTPVAGADFNKVATLNYGSELITYEHGTEWCNVKADGKEGFVSGALVCDSADFYLLNSIFGDAESKETIASVKCRKALLAYFKQNNYMGKMDESLQRQVYGSAQFSKEVWQVFSKAKDVKPNTTFFQRVVNANSKFTDFAALIKNTTTSKRKFLLFTFSDDETSRLVNEQPAPDEGDIKDVKAVYKNGQVAYTVKYSNGAITTSAMVSSVNPNEVSNTVASTPVANKDELTTEERAVLPDFYIISVEATPSRSEAELEKAEFQKQGYSSGVLWIPNYASLSGAKSFCVYIGPFYSQYECEVATDKYRQIDPEAYGVLVSQKKTRVEIRGVGKVTKS